MQYVNEAGKYLAKVLLINGEAFGKNKNDTNFFKLPLVIEEEGSQKGREIGWTFFLGKDTDDENLTEEKFSKLTGVLERAFDFKGSIQELFEDANVFLGREVLVTVLEEEYNGKTYFKAKWINNPSQEAQNADLEKLKEFAKKRKAARNGGVLASDPLDYVPGKPTDSDFKKPSVFAGKKPVAPVKNTSDDLDDIPF